MPTEDPGKLPRLTFREILPRLAVLVMVSYGLLAYSYKYFSPWLGGKGDSPAYYAVYQSPLNFHAAGAPFVLRQVSGVLTWLVWRAHIFYPDLISFSDPGYDQHIFFAALLVNWLSLLFTAFVAGLLAEELLGVRQRTTALFAGFLCLLAFHAQMAVLTDLAEGPGWLLLALAMLALLRRSRVWLAVVLMLALFERELVLLAVAAFAASELLPASRTPGSKRGYPVYAFSVAAACSAAYLLLRHHFSEYRYQLEPSTQVDTLLRLPITRALIFQTLLSQNIAALALIPALFTVPSLPRLRFWLPRFVAVFFMLLVVSFAAAEGNNAGRLAGVLTPLFAASAAIWLTGHPPQTTEIHQPNRTAQVFAGCLCLSVLLAFSGVVYRHYRPYTPGYELKVRLRRKALHTEP